MKKIFAFCCLYLTLNTLGHSQNQILKEFWKKVESNYINKTMDAGVRSWLNEKAEKETGDFFKGKELLKDIQHNYTFQEKILKEMYLFYQNKELLRRALAAMCGSYALGNPVADEIYTKYVNDRSIKPTFEKKEKDKEKRLEAKDTIQKIEAVEENSDNYSPAHFPDGDAAYSKFLKSNFKIPDSLNEINGTIEVEFTIDTSGNVIQPKIISNPLNHNLEQEALRVIEMLPKWIPARKNENSVICIKKQKFTF